MTSKEKKELDRLFSLAVRTRDNYTCQKCGKQHKHVQCAHIFSRSNLSVRWEMRNAITMCYFCHLQWAHRQPVEYTEWIKNYLGADYEKLQELANTKVKINYKEKRKELLDYLKNFDE